MNIKVILAAAAIMAGAAFTTVSAKKKVAKKDCCAAVVLNDGSDSLSYAAGYTYTDGLIPYLQNNLKVDTAFMADFIQGLKDSKEKSTDPRYVAYQAGCQISQMINKNMIEGLSNELKSVPDSISPDAFYAGFISALVNDNSKFNKEGAQAFFRMRMEANEKLKEEINTSEGRKWLEANAKKEGVKTTASGLQYKVITMGTGEKPTATDEVEVKYEGTLIDGTVFDSSYKRDPQTNKFKANQVIKGWTEGLQLMPVGSKFEFYIPQDLAYGSRQMGNIPPYSTLIFTVELVGIIK